MGWGWEDTLQTSQKQLKFYTDKLETLNKEMIPNILKLYTKKFSNGRTQL